MRQSSELQSENARDLIVAWALTTEALLGTGDPEIVESIFKNARQHASQWSDERRSRELQAVLSGEATEAIFNPEFIRSYRRDCITTP
jgi:hypothetical protein